MEVEAEAGMGGHIFQACPCQSRSSEEWSRKWQKRKGMAYELTSDVTGFLMRGNFGIKNLAVRRAQIKLYCFVF